MKKTILLLLLAQTLLFSCLFSFAQSALGTRFPQGEIFISGNTTILYNTGEFNYEKYIEPRHGCGFGISLLFHEIKNFNMVSGVEFDQTSQFRKYQQGGLGGSPHDVTWKFNSLSVPLELRANYGKSVRFFAEAGFLINYTFHAYHQSSHSDVELENGQFVFYHSTTESDWNLKRINFGTRGGIGLSVPVGGLELFTKADYSFWFGEIIPDRNPPIRNSYLRLILGIRI